MRRRFRGRDGARRPGAGSAGWALLMAVVTTGCAAVTSRPVTPGVTAPDAWQATAATPDIVVSDAPQDLSRWWLQLGDRTLSDLVTRALAANLDVRAAQAALREARARRGLAGIDLLPSVSASAGASVSKSSGATQDVYNAGFDASWEPDVFGGTRHAINASQADLQATVASLHDTQVSLVAEVALNYVELRTLQARLTIARDNLARQTETLALTVWRAQAGLTSEVDVEQERTTVAQTRALIPALETSLAEAEHRLAVLAGEPPTALRETLAATAPIPTAPRRVVVGIPADTLRQRPDVRAAEQRLAAEVARLGEAEAARYPSLKLSGALGVDAVSLGGLATAATVARSLVGSLTAPIFDRARIRRQIEIQNAAEEQALIAYEGTVLAALEEVENALVALANARARQASLAEAADAARRAAELARDRYAAGLIGYQTVLDTERTMLSAEDTLTSGEAESTSDLIRLYKALGGGWTPAPAVEPATGAHK